MTQISQDQIHFLNTVFSERNMENIVAPSIDTMALNPEVFPLARELRQNESDKTYKASVTSGESLAGELTESDENYSALEKGETKYVEATIIKIGKSTKITKEDFRRMEDYQNRNPNGNLEAMMRNLGKDPRQLVKSIRNSYNAIAFLGSAANRSLLGGAELTSAIPESPTKGLLTSGIDVFTVRAGVNGADDTEKRQWANKTDAEIYDDILEVFKLIDANVKYSSELLPNTMLVAPDQYKRLFYKPSNLMSVAERISSSNEAYEGLRILKCPMLKYGANKCVIYRNDPQVLELIVSQQDAFEEEPKTGFNGSLTVGFHGHTAGLMVKQKEAMLMFGGI